MFKFARTHCVEGLPETLSVRGYARSKTRPFFSGLRPAGLEGRAIHPARWAGGGPHGPLSRAVGVGQAPPARLTGWPALATKARLGLMWGFLWLKSCTEQMVPWHEIPSRTPFFPFVICVF